MDVVIVSGVLRRVRKTRPCDALADFNAVQFEVDDNVAGAFAVKIVDRLLPNPATRIAA